MGAAVFSIFTLFLLLSGGVFLPEANASDLNVRSFPKSQPATTYGQDSCLRQGIISPEPIPLLLHNSSEQQRQEEVRSCTKGNSAGKGEKGFLLTEAVSLNESLLKDIFNAYSGAVPIWLKVLSLRL